MCDRCESSHSQSVQSFSGLCLFGLFMKGRFFRKKIQQVKHPTFSLHTFEQVIEEIENANAKLVIPTEDHYMYLKHYFTNVHGTLQWLKFGKAMLKNPPIISDHKITENEKIFINTKRAFPMIFGLANVYDLLKVRIGKMQALPQDFRRIVTYG